MKRATILLSVLALSLSSAGCELVGDVLEFGFWAIVILVLLLAAAAWGLFRAIARTGERRRPPS